MKFSINRILSAATVMVVLVVTFILFISIRQFREVSDTAKSISHTERVLTHIQNLLLAVVGNETDSRGYVITGNNQFLESMGQYEKDIRNELALLKSLTADNPVEQSLSDSLSLYTDKRIAFSKQAVVLRRDKGFEAASGLVSTSEGKFYTDKIRHIITVMQQEENRLLAKRKKDNSFTISRFNMILYGVLTAGFILGILTIQSVRSGSRKRKLSEQKFSALLDAAPDATVIVNEKGIIQMANQQIKNLFGYAPEEIIGQPVEILIPKELHSRHVHHRDGFIKEARVRSMGVGIELKAVKKDGVSFPVEISLSPIKTKEGILVSASVRDISDRKKTEDALNQLNLELEQRVKERTEEIFKSEKLYRNLFENMLHGFAYCKAIFEQGRLKDYTYLTVNREYELLTGLKDITGKKVSEVMPGLLDSDPTYTEIVSKVALSGKPEKFETYAEPLGKWFSISLYSPAKEYFVGLVENITERKKAEENLRQSERRLKEAQSITHISNWEIDLVQNVHTWSDEFYRIYGLNKDEVQPSIELFMSFMHPDDADLAQKKIREAFVSFHDSTFDFRFMLKDGITRHGCIEWRFEFDKKGKPIRLFVIMQDITKSKEAEEELRRSIELFQYATQSSLDVIWELNFETKQYLVHKGKEKLFGVNSLIDWELGLDGKYIVEEDKEIVRQSFLEAGMDTARIVWVLEYRVHSENDSILYIINHAMFIRDKKGKAVRVIGAITDITQRKKLELELREQQRNEQLKIIATALEAQEKERNAIGMELHDNVNQILVATKLFLSMVEDDPIKNQGMISSCMENLQNAIQENRKIAHELVAPDFATNSLIDQLLDLADKMLKPLGINVDIDATGLSKELLSDQQKLALYRIAQEQCTNIIKYAKARRVNISLSTTDGFFKMIISDDGAGMEIGKKTKGIGLRNMKGRLSIFNGTTNIQTAPGKGFSLEIEIPVRNN